MLMRNPRAFAFILIAAGLGLVAYYGEAWLRLPEWSEAELEQSAELNLQLDLERMGPHLRPTGPRLEELRQRVRAEVEAEIRNERRQLERWLGLGLLLVVVGAGQAVLSLGIRGPK